MPAKGSASGGKGPSCENCGVRSPVQKLVSVQTGLITEQRGLLLEQRSLVQSSVTQVSKTGKCSVACEGVAAKWDSHPHKYDGLCDSDGCRELLFMLSAFCQMGMYP